MGWDAEQAEDAYWELSPMQRARIARRVATPLIDAQIRRRLEAERVTAEVERRYALLKDYGDGSLFSDGQVLSFERTFIGSDQVWRYAAVRSGGRWWLTGAKSPQGLTWEQLVLWLVSGDVPVSPDRVVVWLGQTISLQGALKSD